MAQLRPSSCSRGAGCAGLVCMLSPTQCNSTRWYKTTRMVAASSVMSSECYARVCLAGSQSWLVFMSCVCVLTQIVCSMGTLFGWSVLCSVIQISSSVKCAAQLSMAHVLQHLTYGTACFAPGWHACLGACKTVAQLKFTGIERACEFSARIAGICLGLPCVGMEQLYSAVRLFSATAADFISCDVQ
jgi:hypothetical protein